MFDFPVMPHHPDEQLEAMGFKVDRWGGDDVYEDVFGERHAIQRLSTLKSMALNLALRTKQLG